MFTRTKYLWHQYAKSYHKCLSYGIWKWDPQISDCGSLPTILYETNSVKESLVINVRKIFNWSLYDEKANSSGHSNTSYNQNVQTLGTHQTEILHVSAFVSLEPQDINNAEFPVLNIQLTNKGYMTNGQQTLTFQLLSQITATPPVTSKSQFGTSVI
jgi:hypothetical protein